MNKFPYNPKKYVEALAKAAAVYSKELYHDEFHRPRYSYAMTLEKAGVNKFCKYKVNELYRLINDIRSKKNLPEVPLFSGEALCTEGL